MNTSLESMKRSTVYTYFCDCCGDEFETNYAQTKYCNKPECKTPVKERKSKPRKEAVSKKERERIRLQNKLNELWG